MKQPPEKLSDLIILAMQDYDIIKADPRYQIDMGEWHRPNGKCRVCLAGSVMANTLKTPINENIYSTHEIESEEWAIALDQLDEARMFDCGWHSIDSLFYDHPRFPGSKEPEYWYESMQDFVGVLQAEGL